MNDERLPRHWSTTKAYDALQRLIEGKHRLHIPVQESDEDRIIAAVIDERDALTAALDAATARAAEWEQRANTAADLVAGTNEAALRDAARLAAADALQAAVTEAILVLGAADDAYDVARLAATKLEN